jgi:putative hydrolase of the HAD superfamily
LNRFLGKVYCFRKIGHKKPSPEFFGYILDDLGLDASRVFMVGDDFESDVLGAVGCGIRAVWFNENSNEARNAKSYETIHDMRSLPRVLVALRAASVPPRL